MKGLSDLNEWKRGSGKEIKNLEAREGKFLVFIK